MNWNWLVGVIGVGVIAVSAAQGDSRTSRDTKGSPVSFRAASMTPVDGYERLALAGSDTGIYVAPRAIWSGGEVVSAQSRDLNGGAALELTLNADAVQRIATITREGGDRLALFVDGKLTSVGVLSSSGGRVTISGLDASSTERVLRLLNGIRPAPAPVPVSAAITAVPSGVEGDLYFVDVYVQGVTSMRSYQVALTVEGGTNGDLVRETVDVEEVRPDFVFANLDVISAADQVGGRAMGVLSDGIVDRAEPGYLATYAFRASPDAAGTFQIRVDTGEKSFLADSENELIAYQAGTPATITIGQTPTRPTLDK
jgi:hypothetical protein